MFYITIISNALKLGLVGPEVFMVASMKMSVFWVVAPHTLAVYQ
jgi:hypothetical protein